MSESFEKKLNELCAEYAEQIESPFSPKTLAQFILDAIRATNNLKEVE